MKTSQVFVNKQINREVEDLGQEMTEFFFKVSSVGP